jgi:hypothetical protein
LLVVRVSLFWGYVALVGTLLVPALWQTQMIALLHGE